MLSSTLLDDFGLAALTEEQRRDLLELLEDRYQRCSTLITSQFPVEHWHDRIGDPTLADAILDRLVHNAYRLTLDRRFPAPTPTTIDNHRALNSIIDNHRALNSIINHPRRYAPRGGSFGLEQVAAFRWTEWQISVEYAA